ncbi:MAG: amino acid permease [Spirochaetes bacterium]|nr:MAG: amino acid permease [Spirochaetota bacterium]
MAIDGLKRVLGLPEVTFISIGMTMGAGIFVFTGIVLKIVGPALPLAYAIAVIPVFLSMLPLAMLGSALPTTGGNYKYPSRMVSPGFTFVGIWVYILATFFGQIPLYSMACARYARLFFPGLSIELFAVVLISFLFIINIIGIKPAVQVQGVLVILAVAAKLYFSGNGLIQFHAEYMDDFMQMGTGSLFLGVGLLTFTYLGSNGIIELGDEIKNPGKVIPRAYFITFPVVTIVYLTIAFAAVGVVPWQGLVGVDEPLIAVSQSCLGPAGVAFFVLCGAIVALVSTLNALFIIGTKSLLMIISDGLLPAFLGRIHKRFGTAHILFIIIWILSICGVLSGLSLETFASYSALAGILIFLPLLIASLRLPKLYPDKYAQSEFKLKGFWLYFCPIMGFVLILFFSAVILADLKSPMKIGFFLLFILSGFVYYMLRKRYLKSKGINLDDLRTKEEWK